MAESLLNNKLIVNKLTNAKWCRGHGAVPGSSYLGFSLFYYGLVYAFRARMAVCIGSGGGFVPRMMRQAQLDLGMKNSSTILIDMDDERKKWGRPNWTSPDSFFRENWPDIVWWKEKSEDSIEHFPDSSIDALHIDADHSRALEDFRLYEPKVRIGGFVTLHDTNIVACNAMEAVEFMRESDKWDVIHFKDVGAGKKIGVAMGRKRE